MTWLRQLFPSSPRTIAQKLRLVMAAVMLPAVIATGLFAYWTFRDNLRAQHALTQQTARALTAVLDADLGGLAALAQLLTHGTVPGQNELPALFADAQRLQRSAALQAVALCGADDVQHFNTQRPFGSTLPRCAPQPPGTAWLVRDALSGQLVVALTTPVAQPGHPPWHLELHVPVARFAQLLADQKLPAHWIGVVIDARGIIVARTRLAASSVGARVGTPLLRAVATRTQGELDTVTREGIAVTSMYSRAPKYGWAVALAEPNANVHRERLRSYALLGAGALLLLVGGFTLAAMTGGSIAASMRHLVAHARALGRGATSEPPALPLHEAAELAREFSQATTSLRTTDAARQQAVAALQQLNAELEGRVEQRTAEVRRSQQLLDAVVEHIPVMIIVQQGVSGRFEYFNRAAEAILPAPRHTLLGKTWDDILPPADAATCKAVERALRAPGAGTLRQVHTMHLANGSSMTLECDSLLLRAPAGQPEYLLRLAVDVTASRAAAQQLRIAATAFDAQEPMLITDDTGRIVRANPAFLAMSRYSAQELEGQSPHLLHSGRHDQAFYRSMWQQIQQAGVWQGELWNRRRSGEVFPCWATITAIHDPAGIITNYVAVYVDITERKRAEEEIRLLAFFDPLTGLPNRRLLMDRIQHALASAARSGRVGALMFIDLDNFKTLNDTLGHDQGDALLRQVATRLPTCVREGDTVARHGGDEFIVMLENLDAEREHAAVLAAQVGAKLLAVLSAPYVLAGRPYVCTPSIGVALFGGDGIDREELLKHADLAMYEAKASGRHAVRFFEPPMQAAIGARAALEAELRAAVDTDALMLYYQPQLDLYGRVIGAEALLRWDRPGHGLTLPDEFIALAEETRLILPIGQWVLETACVELARWEHVPALAHLHLSINVSARQLEQPGFPDQVRAALRASGARADRLQLELTEGTLLRDIDASAARITELRATGIRIALDDFGVGYCSLSYLRRLRIDQLKIDRSFVRNLAEDPGDAAIARAIVTLADTLGLGVVAEGVETAGQRAMLERQGCKLFQGFLYAKALTADAFESYVAATRDAAA
jgi:diguanylate cyclase (GGDEF)-like protein/PAS domain S-box-containing protein